MYEYLDLLEKKLDDTQRAVCCRTKNTIVAAGAGSGKTQVLATRFAWLVMSENIKAPEILTLTFTKKAAGEMYERIYQTLKFFAENDKTPEKEKTRAKQAMEDFSNVHIQTLDSYCTGIVRQAANLYGIRPDFTSGSEDSTLDIKKLALPFVLTNRNNPAVQTFSETGNLQNFAENTITQILVNNYTIADEKDFFSKKGELQKKLLLQIWNYFLAQSGNRPDSVPESWIKFSDALNLGTTALGLFKNKEKDAYKNLDKALKLLEVCTFSSVSDFKDFYSDKINQQINSLKEGAAALEKVSLQGQRDEVLKEGVNSLKGFMLNIVPLFDYILQFDSISAFFKLLDQLCLSVNNSKRTKGNLTFADVTELALKILIEQKQIRFQEKSSYSKIMIDEFQDNNGKNRDLLFLLSEKDFENEEYGCKDGIPEVEDIKEDKLFFVGDEKQSIYKFRGADVSVFNQLKNDLGKENFLQMYYNYRSDSQLISCFNKFFGENNFIFDGKTKKTFEAKYESFAKKYDPKNRVEIPDVQLNCENVRIHTFMLDTNKLQKQKDVLNAKNTEAYFIAKKIYEMYSKNPDPDKKLSDFAILDKSRTNRYLLIKWLNHFGLTYVLDQNSSLFSDGPINDIYNFLRLCVYPLDSVALAAYLASPLCGLTQSSVEAVLAGEEPASKAQKLKYEKAKMRLDVLRSKILSQPLSSSISQLWNDWGYKYETMLSKQKSLYSEQFDMLFELTRTCDQEGKNISWFVDELGKIRNKEISTFGKDVEINAKDVSYPLEREDGIQIMTIHKSKGLQFKTVFMWGCTEFKAESDGSSFFYSDEFGLTLKPEKGADNIFVNLQKEMAKEKELAEFRRVIYVGITRAIKEVYIVGKWKQIPSEKKSSSDESNHLIQNLISATYQTAASQPNFAFEKPVYKENSAFDFCQIQPVNKAEAYKTIFEDKEKDKNELLQLYSKTETVTYQWPLSNRKTPSSLETETKTASGNGGTNSGGSVAASGNNRTACGSESDSDSGEKYDTSSDVLTNGNFDAADFGTLVHAFLEGQANGISPENFEPEVKLWKNLSESQIAENRKKCIGFCKQFAASELGKAAYGEYGARTNKRFIKAEWAFRMFEKNQIWTGSIDLIFQKEDKTYVIVDYKSDEHLNPEKYFGQQNCYRTAASKMLNVNTDKIKCYLYGLKENLIVEVENKEW